jgi:hypothetical protein
MALSYKFYHRWYCELSFCSGQGFFPFRARVSRGGDFDEVLPKTVFAVSSGENELMS